MAKKAVTIGNHYIGEVITYFDDKGYGFIQPLGEKYKAAFFHVSQMLFGDLPTEGARYHFTGIEGREDPAAGDLFTADGVTPEDYCRLVGEEGSYTPTVAQEDELRRNQVDKNDDGDKLFKVTKHNRFAHFEVERANNGGRIILNGVHSLAEARKKIGKTIKHPATANHGQSTNDPSVSKGMKNAPSKKKEAA